MVKHKEVKQKLTLVCRHCGKTEDHVCDYTLTATRNEDPNKRLPIVEPTIMVEPYAALTAFCPDCGKEALMVDSGIVQILRLLWRLGYETKGSCEGNFIPMKVERPELSRGFSVEDCWSSSYVAFASDNNYEKMYRLVRAAKAYDETDFHLTAEVAYVDPKAAYRVTKFVNAVELCRMDDEMQLYTSNNLLFFDVSIRSLNGDDKPEWSVFDMKRHFLRGMKKLCDDLDEVRNNG